MAKHSVDVLIKARDRASKIFGFVGTSAKVMGAALKSAAKITRAAFTKAFQIAKKAVIGLAAAFAYCTYAAIKQQAAEVELASALKVTGQYSDTIFEKLKKQAGAIQDATVYGDEYILTLQRMAITQGVTADKASDVAKAAIALHAGFGGGKGKPEIFLRYYVDALRETGSSLESYVGDLRKAKTQEEKMIILQKALAKGWDVAKSKSDHAGGALFQMKNKLGDVAETIATPFLPAITRSAHAVTRWAKENEANITWWAKKTYIAVTLAKDVFMNFVDYMKEDWRGAMAFAFDSFLKLLKATFESAVIMAIAAGKGIWKGIKMGLAGTESGRSKERSTMFKKLYEEKYGVKPVLPTMTTAIWKGFLKEQTKAGEIAREAEKQIPKEQAANIIGGSFKAIKVAWGDAFAAILKDMPAYLREGYEESKAEWRARLKSLGERPGRQPVAPGEETGAPAPFSIGALADAIKKSISGAGARLGAPLIESRFLTSAPGQRFNKIETNTDKSARSARDLVKLGIKTVRELKAIREKEGVAGIQLLVSKFS